METETHQESAELKRRADELSRYLTLGVRRIGGAMDGDDHSSWRACLDVENSHIGEAVMEELRTLVAENSAILQARSPESQTKELAKALASPGPGRHSCEVLWRLLAEPGDREPDERALETSQQRYLPRWLTAWFRSRLSVVTFMIALILMVLAAGFIAYYVFGQRFADHSFTDMLLRAFAVWVFAFLPGWMFLRFIGGRAGALWNEYVMNLHRLRWDRPRNLPRPSQTSEYYERWRRDGGEVANTLRNIYREKFDAYYGRYVSRSGDKPSRRIRSETLFPVYLATLVFAVCWTVFLWDPHVLMMENVGNPYLPVFAYAFLGAYVFIVEMLIRRFFQNDLRASAYLGAVIRVIVVLIVIAVIRPFLSFENQFINIAIAFVIGFFPLVGLQLLRNVAAWALRIAIPSLRAKYPLSDLDGLNIWYEARLLEEGIEDMENLATANFVDVMLHTKVPVGRLVDWVNQAYLLIHIPPENGRNSVLPRRLCSAHPDDGPQACDAGSGEAGRDEQRGEPRARCALHCLGIRTATDLLEAFPLKNIEDAEKQGYPRHMSDAFAFLEGFGVNRATIQTLVRILARTPGLNPVFNWQYDGVQSPVRPDSPVKQGL